MLTIGDIAILIALAVALIGVTTLIIIRVSLPLYFQCKFNLFASMTKIAAEAADQIAPKLKKNAQEKQ